MTVKKKRPHAFNPHDRYFEMAKEKGYRARSAFKLLEIQEKWKMIRPKMTIIDVASAPGSFLQVIHEIMKDEGIIVGIDLQKIEPLPYKNIFCFQQDIRNFDALKASLEEIGVHKCDVLTSDIAPATTGMTGVDQYRSVELNLAIWEFAQTFLKKGGNMILKVFIGEDFNDLLTPLKQGFDKVQRHKPLACRDRSFEEYVICFGKKE